MSIVHRPDRAPQELAELVRRCKDLCGRAELSLRPMHREAETFLSTNLGDVLTQLELVLRAVEEQGDQRVRREGRRGLLRKLFRREPLERSHAPAAPDFDVTRQGLQGNSSTVPVGELLGFLAFGQKTGVLWVDTPYENFLVGLVDGVVRHAASDRTPAGLRLGEVLVAQGALTGEQLERLVQQMSGQGAGGTILGERLVASGVVRGEDLCSALEFQVQQLVRRLVEAPTALFRFREGMELPVAYPVTLDVNRLLLESARAQDEEARGREAEEWRAWSGELTEEIRAATGAELDPGAGPDASAS